MDEYDEDFILFMRKSKRIKRSPNPRNKFEKKSKRKINLDGEIKN
jgi:hypothetical protein